jgi:hypothetical protein
LTPLPHPPSASLVTGALIAGVVAGVVASCAALGGDDGGGAHLPNRGVVPWTRVTPNDAPFILVPPANAPSTRWREPNALVRDGAVHLYVEARDTADDSARVLWATSEDGVSFTAPSVALADAAAPSAAIAADGTTWLAFAAPDGAAIGLVSSADGAVFDGVAAEVVATATGDEVVASPSLVIDGDRLVVYFTRATTGSAPVIARVSGPPSGPFTPDGVALEAGAGCLASDGAAEPCWDDGGVTSPDVRLATTPAGRRVFRLFYRGVHGATGALGFAASWDGLTFSRFPFNPVIDERFDEVGPSSVRLGDRYLLYWSEERSASAHGIALGVDDSDAPTDRW